MQVADKRSRAGSRKLKTVERGEKKRTCLSGETQRKKKKELTCDAEGSENA